MGGPVADGQLGVGQLCAPAVTAQGKPDAGCGAVCHAPAARCSTVRRVISNMCSPPSSTAARPEILLFSVSLPYHKNRAAAHNLHEMRSFSHKRFLVSSDFTRLCACFLYTLPNTASKHRLFRTNNAPSRRFADAGGVKLHFLFLLRLPSGISTRQLKPTRGS